MNQFKALNIECFKSFGPLKFATIWLNKVTENYDRNQSKNHKL